MHTQVKAVTVLTGLLMLASLSSVTAQRTTPTPRPRPQPLNFHARAVYVLTNQVQNAVAVFNRTTDGHLTAAGQFPTGGAGDPVAIPPDPPVDPLASQGALVFGPGNQFLFAVNAGSNEISVFSVGRARLDLVDVVNSGGVRPISLTVHENLLYVLNEGGTPNITGFTVGNDGTLTPLAGSARSLIGGTGADPAEVSFNNDGTLLVVTEKLGNRLDSYTINQNGLPSPPMANASSGMTPFGFDFNSDDFLVVSEAFALMPGQAAASSYASDPAGILSVVTGSLHNNQTASCWVVIPNNGMRAIVSNTASGTISTYNIDGNGMLTLANAVAANLGPTSAPRDMALSVNGQILFVQTDGGQSVAVFHVENNGALTPVDTAGGLPFGAQGIAAK
ncbi:MAG TPA: beta-propeller fold lactonase family protein [Terriglobales bacterium]